MGALVVGWERGKTSQRFGCLAGCQGESCPHTLLALPGVLSERRGVGGRHPKVHHQQVPFAGPGAEGVPPEAGPEEGAGAGGHPAGKDSWRYGLACP